MADLNYVTGSFLAGKFVEAKKMYPKQLAVFEELNESLPAAMTSAWQEVDIEPKLGEDGKWTSPFKSSELSGAFLDY